MQARPYQIDGKNSIFAAWRNGFRNVLYRLDTGGGKTFIFSDIVADFIAGIIAGFAGPSIAIAHRQELVGQIALAFARRGIRHRIIAPRNVIKFCVAIQIEELGTTYYDPNASAIVAGVDTIISRVKELAPLLATVRLWVMDEAHHITAANKWGKAIALIPNAYGLGVTATPGRADGKGLGRHADGVFDILIEGPPMRWLIDNRFLSDYRIYCSTSDIDLATVEVGSTGDYKQKQLIDATHESTITGDIVRDYLRFAAGERGITFLPDVRSATETAARFNAAGIAAEVITAKTPDRIRTSAIRRFSGGELKQLVNVDIFSEGFDVPAVSVVSMGRATASYNVYSQQFGRALRTFAGKLVGKIIDHVGNVIRHNGPPDRPRIWTLDRRDKRAKSNVDDAIPMRICTNPNCVAPYERTLSACPHCGAVPEIADRSEPKFVDGDLCEMSPELLARLRGEVSALDMPVEQYREYLASRNVPTVGQLGHVNRHVKNQQAQSGLRDVVALWAGWQRHRNKTDSESYRTFFYTFGIDVVSAQALKKKDADALRVRVESEIELYRRGIK